MRAHHNLGVIGGWGYVEGGMGRVSFAIAEAALEAGAVLATGVGVGAFVPGTGVLLDGGELVRARAVLSNADPKATLALCPGDVPAGFRSRVDAWRMDSPVVKVNCALHRLPRFIAAGPGGARYRAMVTISTGIDATQAGFEACRRGQRRPAWCELYFQTAYDPGVLASPRTWSTASSTSRCWARFKGCCLPDQMWDRRFGPRTPVEGLYLCAAATHPGGSVIGVNGRNAALAVLADLERRPAYRGRGG
ncbi:MAG: hypothetical protein LC792_11440 [Actinobacteria bacterium]|nr:hypothetical protein [Actinomycetota bacterium]